jgi:hypothetical protein
MSEANSGGRQRGSQLRPERAWPNGRLEARRRLGRTRRSRACETGGASYAATGPERAPQNRPALDGALARSLGPSSPAIAPGSGPVHHWSMVDQQPWPAEGVAGAWRSAFGRRSSPWVRRKEEGVAVVLTDDEIRRQRRRLGPAAVMNGVGTV